MKRNWLALVSMLSLSQFTGCGSNDPPPRRVAVSHAGTDDPSSLADVGSMGYRLAAVANRTLFPEPTLEQTAVNALGRIGSPAVAELATALKDPDARLRNDAAQALAKMGSDAKLAVPELIVALNDPEESVRRIGEGDRQQAIWRGWQPALLAR
jgi:HEAT repeat protein